MGTWTRVLEITVISGEDLHIRRKQPVKKNAFVVIRTDSNNNQEQRTSIDKEGGSYPAWNEKLAIELPINARFVNVEVQCCQMGGRVSKFIGGVNIPVTDFIGGLLPENYLHFLSYRLRNRDGGKNGIINLSLRVNGPHYQGFDAISCGGKVTNGVGIGIPLSNFK